MIETHSDHVVNGLRIAMKQELSGLAPNNAEIIFSLMMMLILIHQ